MTVYLAAAGLVAGAIIILRDYPVHGQAVLSFSSPLGVSAGTATRATVATGVSDSLAGQPPQLVGQVTDEAIAEQIQQLQQQYVGWTRSRPAVAYVDQAPRLPAAAGFAPPPDASEGELTAEQAADAQ